MALVRTENVKIGERLVERGLITKEELERALREQKAKGGFIGQTLIRLGLVREEEILPLLSEQLGIPYLDVEGLTVDPKVLEKVPAKFASHYRLLPVRFEEGVLTVVVTDPLDLQTLDDIRLLLGVEVQAILGGERQILEAIRKHYGLGAGTLDALMGTEGAPFSVEEARPTAEDIKELAGDASVVKFVNQILQQALHDRATDIHFEPFEKDLRIRFRIDGILHDIHFPPTIKNFQSAIISRIKIMANLDIAEKRLPQDGRIKIREQDKELDLRVSILPTPFGESINIRLLSSNVFYGLEKLGLSSRDQQILEKIIQKPHGIIFVTGPTGSGKTTTLYACLSKLNRPENKIITIEDPIEYQMKGITQVQISPKVGLTFAHGLRTMLRHDPDIMMVGEVRDPETAEITIRIALTGHLVFSTLHTNDAAGAVARLLDMGIEPYLLSASLECLMAQRLVRVICHRCKKAVTLDEGVARQFGWRRDQAVGAMTFYRGSGCEACKFTGYLGRTAIYELIVVDESIRELINRSAPTSEIKQKALQNGMRTLRQDGWEKVSHGITTPEEVMRVTQEET